MKLSVITVNYNNVAGLERTIQSVLSQSFADFEYLVVDGGSTDGSTEKISKFATPLNLPRGEKKEWFNWISEPDEGIYFAMNKGIRLAKGDYCLFLNSGDYLCDENVLEKVFENNPSADVVIGNELRGNGRVKAGNSVSFFDLYCSSLPHQSTFIRRSLFDEIGFYNEELKIVSDWEFWIKAIVINNCSVEKIEIDITVYDITGISNSDISLRDKERKLVLNSFLPNTVLRDYEIFRKYRKIITLSENLSKRIVLYRTSLDLITKLLRVLNRIFK